MASSKNFQAASEQLAKLDSILSSPDIKQKVKNIKEIIGEKNQSSLISPEESRQMNSFIGKSSAFDKNKLSSDLSKEKIIFTEGGIS